MDDFFFFFPMQDYAYICLYNQNQTKQKWLINCDPRIFTAYTL